MSTRQAQKRPVKIDSAIMDERRDYYAKFVSLAYHLQLMNPRAPILLPLELVGKLLNVSQKTISYYRDFAKDDGFLKEVSPYEMPSVRRPGRATEFQFDLSKVELQ